MATIDKHRTIQAALGRINTRETVKLGDWTFGYLSLRIGEVEELGDIEETLTEGGMARSKAYMAALTDIALRRCLDDPAPTADELSWGVGMDELSAYIGWLRGGAKPGGSEAEKPGK